MAAAVGSFAMARYRGAAVLRAFAPRRGTAACPPPPAQGTLR
ncbi:hypothetical protein [Streptomyces kaniharaensis]|nr:hypothetical protein [Streptomyces kaniharaensis]